VAAVRPLAQSALIAESDGSGYPPNEIYMDEKRGLISTTGGQEMTMQIHSRRRG
jgi:hypothetical protein